MTKPAIEESIIGAWTLLRHKALLPLWVHKDDVVEREIFIKQAMRMEQIYDFPRKRDSLEIKDELEIMELPKGHCPECGKQFEPGGYCSVCDA